VSGAVGLWLRIAAATAIAFGSLLLLSPDRPDQRLATAVSIAVGTALGVAMFVAVVGRGSRLAVARGSVHTAFARWIVFGLLAANEELVWRRAVLGECLGAGSAAALAGSTLVFAVAHRARPGLHLGTGAAFGGVYLATGVLGASIAAHWIYNGLLSSAARPSNRIAGSGR
jgi:membrane protease YdiL (CAAX protease family)